MVEKRSSTLSIRIKGIVFGALTTLISFFLFNVILRTQFFYEGFGGGAIGQIVQAGAQFVFGLLMLSGVVVGLRQCFTGKDLFTSFFASILSDKNESTSENPNLDNETASSEEGTDGETGKGPDF